MKRLLFKMSAILVSAACMTACSRDNLLSQKKNSDADNTSASHEYYDPGKVGIQFYEDNVSTNSDFNYYLCDNVLSELAFKYYNTLVDGGDIIIKLNRIFVDDETNNLNMELAVLNDTGKKINVNCSYFSYDDCSDLSNAALSDIDISERSDKGTICLDMSDFTGWPEDNDLRKIGSFAVSLDVSGDKDIQGDTYIFPVIPVILSSESVYDSNRKTTDLEFYVSDYAAKTNSSVMTVAAVNNSDNNIRFDLGNKCSVNGTECELDSILLCNAGETTLKKLHKSDINTIKELIEVYNDCWRGITTELDFKCKREIYYAISMFGFSVDKSNIYI